MEVEKVVEQYLVVVYPFFFTLGEHEVKKSISMLTQKSVSHFSSFSSTQLIHELFLTTRNEY